VALSLLKPITNNESELRKLPIAEQSDIWRAYVATQFAHEDLSAVENALHQWQRLLGIHNGSLKEKTVIKEANYHYWHIAKAKLMQLREQVDAGLALQKDHVQALLRLGSLSEYEKATQLFQLGYAYDEQGLINDAKPLFEASRQIWQKQGFNEQVHSADFALAKVMIWQGHHHAALDELLRLDEMHTKMGSSSGVRANILQRAADAELALGELTAARSHIEESYAIAVEHMGVMNVYSTYILLTQVEVMIAQGEDIADVMKTIRSVSKAFPDDGYIQYWAEYLQRLSQMNQLSREGQYRKAEHLLDGYDVPLELTPLISRANFWKTSLYRAEIAAQLGNRVAQGEAIKRAVASVGIYQEKDGLGYIEVSAWQQCFDEKSATNAVARLAKALGPEHHRVKALMRCWN
jgi:tetratricopeptide (TPR) repeat protein